VAYYDRYDELELMASFSPESPLAYELPTHVVITQVAAGRQQAAHASIVNASVPDNVLRVDGPPTDALALVYVGRPDAGAVLRDLSLPAGAIVVAPIPVVNAFLAATGRRAHTMCVYLGVRSQAAVKLV
jgi:hypothetical protein